MPLWRARTLLSQVMMRSQEKYGYQTTTRAKITRFWFEIEDNDGKLLDNQLVWNDSDNPQFNDFTNPVTFTVGSDDDFRDYTVTLSNTGLPVVVLKQSGSGDYDKKYDGGFDLFGSHIGGTLLNEFVDFMVRGKDTDWQTDDQMLIYMVQTAV